MSERTYFLISIPVDFEKKFIGFLKNLNNVNSSEKESPIVIESIYVKKKIVAIPKTINIQEMKNGS